jgi:hypothetical protein
MPGFTPRVITVITRLWQPHPIAVAYARAIGDGWGKGIDGQRGTIIANSSADSGFMGYAQPPQLFAGWNPRYQTSVGTTLTTPGGLPGTSVPGANSPMDSAMATIMAGTSS